MCLRQLKYNLKKAMTSLFCGGKPDDGAAVGRPQYLSTTTLHKHCKHQGPVEPEGPEAMCAPHPLCIEVGFYADISWESRCSSEIKV